MCKNFEAQGRCRYGPSCNYAHGLEDLRQRSTPHFKARNCAFFLEKGVCPYGPRCQYFHPKENQIFTDLLDALTTRLEIMEVGASRSVTLHALLTAEDPCCARLAVFERLVPTKVEQGNLDLSQVASCYMDTSDLI